MLSAMLSLISPCILYFMLSIKFWLKFSLKCPKVVFDLSFDVSLMFPWRCRWLWVRLRVVCKVNLFKIIDQRFWFTFTLYQFVCPFYKITTELKTILKGKWILTFPVSKEYLWKKLLLWKNDFSKKNSDPQNFFYNFLAFVIFLTF